MAYSYNISMKYRSKDLPEKTQEMLERVTMLPPSELTWDDIGFLRARRDYLRPEQLEVYASVLEVKATPKKK